MENFWAQVMVFLLSTGSESCKREISLKYVLVFPSLLFYALCAMLVLK
jgi:hypothetical protein